MRLYGHHSDAQLVHFFGYVPDKTEGNIISKIIFHNQARICYAQPAFKVAHAFGYQEQD
jgi:hypothetical protein